MQIIWRADEACDDCHGTGQFLAHSRNCEYEECALNGDMYSCDGELADCHCTTWRIDADPRIAALKHRARFGQVPADVDQAYSELKQAIPESEPQAYEYICSTLRGILEDRAAGTLYLVNELPF